MSSYRGNQSAIEDEGKGRADHEEAMLDESSITIRPF